MVETSASSVYTDLKIPHDEDLISRIADKVDGIPSSVSLDERFTCSYETMVVADLALTRAGKRSFPETGRLTDDDLSNKAVKDEILLSDQPFPAAPVTAEFLSTHIRQYAVPPDGDAVFAHVAWRAAYLRSVTNKVGISGLGSPEADKLLTKARSKYPADTAYRRRANLGIGERRCYDLIGIPLVSAAAEKLDTEKISGML